MKTEIISWVQIKTPRGKATINKINRWKSDDKEFEKDLNEDFGLDSGLTTYEQRISGFAPYVLADQAIRKYGGKIIQVRRKMIEETKTEYD